MTNILFDPVFGVERPDGSRGHLSLPEVLRDLGAAEAVEFTALRPHQRHAWYALLTQVAAQVCHQTDGRLEKSAEEWRSGLLGLTGGAEEPWNLVARWDTDPAFLQPPIGGKLKLQGKDLETPDASALDTLVTGRRFEVQPDRIQKPLAEHWVYALAALQTGSGYSGRDLYGVARMRHVYASRVAITRAASARFGARFSRDVQLWLHERAELIRRYGLSENGHGLLWTLPWGGSKEEMLEARYLDPFAIEVARLVRLKEYEGRIVADYCPTKAPRISPESRGLIGDLWGWHGSFKDGEDPALFALGENGWSVSVVVKLLFGDAYAPAMSSFGLTGKPSVLLLEGVARGQGKTFGYHERSIPMPVDVSSALGRDTDRARLGELAVEFLKIASEARLRVLRFGVLVLLGGGSARRVDRHDKRPGNYIAPFDREVDQVFFPALWEASREAEETWRPKWSRTMFEIASRAFEAAIRSVPYRSSARYAIEANARNAFEANARNALPDAFARKEEPRDEH